MQVSIGWVAELADGLICLTGGPRGAIGSALKTDHPQLAENRLLSLKGIFGDRLYVEVQRAEGYDRVVGGEDHRSRLQPRAAAGRDQRGFLPGSGGLRGA